MTGRATDDQPIQMGSFAISINPGSGNVIDATEQHAIDNMPHFVTDLNIDGEVRWLREARNDGRGRFGFLVYWGSRCASVDMPGLPLHRVRFVGTEDQNAWDFPRLYVDESSWLWKFAINVTRGVLTREEEDEE